MELNVSPTHIWILAPKPIFSFVLESLTELESIAQRKTTQKSITLRLDLEITQQREKVKII